MSVSESGTIPVEQLKALAHPLRFQILDLLKGGELNVGEIESASGIGQPSLSQQLGVLRKAGLVRTRKDAKLVYYAREEAKLSALAEMIGSDGDRAGSADPARRKSAPGAANFARMA